MRNDVRMVRGLAVGAVSVFLVAGAAFAADGLIRTGASDNPAIVSPTDDSNHAESTEGTETPEPTATGGDANTRRGDGLARRDRRQRCRRHG